MPVPFSVFCLLLAGAHHAAGLRFVPDPGEDGPEDHEEPALVSLEDYERVQAYWAQVPKGRAQGRLRGYPIRVDPGTGGTGCEVRAGSRRNPITKTEQPV